jgi:serine/threonine protein kinase
MTYQPGEIILHKYRIEELIGRGAFAEVYRVTHLELNVPRALKVLHREAPGVGSTEFSDFQGRFQLEAQLGAKLNSPTPHPNLLQVHDFHKDGDQLFLEMEFAPGGSLAQRITASRESGEPISIDDAIRIGIDIAAGLAELHNLDVVHRDLKPSNIIFDDQGRAKVADFGLAQVPGGPSMRSKLSQPAPHPGSPGYMSPEQERSGQVLRQNSDVYAIGLAIFETLTGRNYTFQKPGTRASKLREDIPEWLDDLLVQMLAEDPANRPWDGNEAAILLQETSQEDSEDVNGDILPGSESEIKKLWSRIPGLARALIVGLLVVGISLGLNFALGTELLPGMTQTPVVTGSPVGAQAMQATPTPKAIHTFTIPPTETATKQPSATFTAFPTETTTDIPKVEIVNLPAVLSDLYPDVKLTFSEVFDTLSDEYWIYRGAATLNNGALEITGENWSDLLMSNGKNITSGECVFVDYYIEPGLDDIRLGLGSGEHNTDSYKRVALNISDGPHLFLQEGEDWVVSDQINLGADPEIWYTLLVIVDNSADVKVIIWEKDDTARRVEWIITPPDLEGDSWGFHALAGNGTMLLDNYGECSLGSE